MPTLSFTRTAADCHISPATLSRTVQRLEAATGHRLLERGPHGVSLTHHGRSFRRYATEALDLWACYHNGDTVDDLSGHLRVFASVTACESLLPDLLTPLRTTHPRVRISLRTGDAASALALLDQGETDLAVAALPDRIPATLLTRQITHTPLVLIQAAALTAEQAPDLNKPFVLPRQGLVRTAADHWFRSLGIHRTSPPRPTVTKPCSPWWPSATAQESSPTSCCSTAASAPDFDSCPPPPAPANSPSGSASDGPTCIAPLIAAAWAETRPGQSNRSEHAAPS